MDRITATKARLEEITAFARRARDAGPPCSDCRYKTLLSNCSNPAYAEPHFEAAVGSYEEMFFTPTQRARADDGLCGPEALLFEPKTIPLVAASAAWTGAKVAWFGAIGLVFAVFLLAR